jgi:hypothetical protein
LERSSNVRVDGETTHEFDETAREMQRQMASTQLTNAVNRDKGVTRGSSGTARVDLDNMHVMQALNAPKLTTYNPLDVSRDAEADARYSDKNDEAADAVVARSNEEFNDRGDHWAKPSQ